MEKKAYHVLAVAAVAAVAFLLIWHNSRGQPQAPKPDRLIVGVLYSTPQTLFFIARDKGYFQQEGLEVDTKIFSSGPEINEAILGGRLDAQMTAESAIILAAKGPIRVISAVSIGKGRRRIMVPMDSDAKTIKDLDGKTIGLTKTAALLGNWKLLEQYNNITAASIINIDAGHQPDAIRTKQVDALFTREPTGSLIEYKGYGRWIPTEQVPHLVEAEVLVAREDSLKRNPEAFKKLIRALKSAESFMKENPEESFEIMSRVFSLPMNVTRRSVEFSDYSTNITDDVRSSFDMVADFLVQDGTLAKKPESILDMAYYGAV